MTSRPKRKLRTRDFFTPIRAQEERDLVKALHVSLRPIPSGDISEDDVEEEIGDQRLKESFSDEEDDFIEDKNQRDQYEVKWATNPQSLNVIPFDNPEGITKPLRGSKNVKHFFELMFSKKVWYHITKQTNLYAKQRGAIHPDPDWKPVTITELKAWVGCLIAMGLNVLPTIKMYWEPPWNLSLVSNRFSRTKIPLY
jgi:hypothetical protein